MQVEDVVVSVRDSAVDEVKSSNCGLLADISFYCTIDGLFDRIKEAIDGNTWEIVIEYDPELGYLRRAYIDYDHCVADEERYLGAYDLVPVE